MNAQVLSLRERVSPPLLVWLVVLWLLLWGDVSWANVVSGTVLALLVTVVLPMPKVTFGVRLRPLRIVALLARFVVDLFAASAQVAWLAVRPGRQPRNSVVKVPLHSGSDLFVTMTAELVSLVPGSVIVELGAPSLQGGQGSIYVHALGVDTEEGRQRIRREVLLTERRVLRTFATPQVYAQYLDRCRADGSDSLCDGGPR
ncbi:Na+/H+ antiporter subunit E [Kineococcus aurantiacus]|uniref:Multicomponent Na+:H+ antiporter subunit E n=1 Tax=Kineococcus aurantiacus TaxID=37633 RepID=A0A7Y9DLC1_9ACTN|nr:multicomponent Na+:H+ antiporter subunit E [Kineococcus aurantiacus]